MPRIAFIPLLIVCLLSSSFSNASVVIKGTRVIFQAGESEAVVQLKSNNHYPNLVQTWIDEGDASATPDQLNVPFLITPPIFRIEGGAEQNIRILFLADKADLPKDRESVFWLNVLEVPPKPNAKGESINYLQLAFRSRIKLFYRPAKLPVSADQVMKHVAWAIQKTPHGVRIIAENKSPYHITLRTGVMQFGEREVQVPLSMIAPYDIYEIDVPASASESPEEVSLSFKQVNDTGGRSEHKVVLKWMSQSGG